MDKKARIDVRPTVFVLLMLLGAFFVVAPGIAVADQEGDYTYEVSGSPAAATITGYNGPGGAITIPSTLGGHPVVAIGDIGFFGDSLTSVIIPDGVTKIGNQSFMDCQNLASVSIPGSVTSIGDSAFSNDALTTVVIPISVLTIGELAFHGNTHLTSIIISNGVTSIGRLAFASDRSLTSVNIPSSVTSIGENAFLGCFALNTLNVDANNPNYTSIDDVMYDKALTTLIKCANGKSGALTVPSTVTSIEDTACNACKNLTSVVFPSSLTSIGDYAFDSCIGLTSVTIPGNVTSIGTDAFGFCYGLTSIRFLGLVAPTTVGADWISNDAANMEGHAYAASNFPAPGGVWNGLTMGAVIAATEDYTYTVSDGKATITGYTGAGGAITIPSTLGGYPVLAIGAYAFANHTSLTSVTIPDGVTIIGKSAFQSCSSMTSITIPNSVTTIGKYSFWFCTSLTSVSIPNSVTSIEFGAFDYCTAVTSLTIGSGVTTIGEYAFEQCTSLTSVTIPNSVTSIGSFAFFACYALTAVTIGSGVTTIGDSAFSYCTSLTSVTIPNSVTSIGASAFIHCTSLTSIAFSGLVAPTTVGGNWVLDTNVGLRGHAYAASNFPAPGGVWNGLTMGAVIPVATVLGTPTNLTTTPANAQVVLAWTAPVDDGGSAITGYKLYRSTTSGGTYSLIASPTALTYTDTGLTNGQTYWYKVSAVNVNGVGANCTAVSALVPQPVSPASDDSMLILVGVIAIAVVLVAVLLFMRRKKK